MNENLQSELENINKIYLQKYGENTQIIAAVEELNEFSAAILKAVKVRGGGHTSKKWEKIRQNVLKELADVLFTMGYIGVYFDFSEEEINGKFEKVIEENKKKLEK